MPPIPPWIVLPIHLLNFVIAVLWGGEVTKVLWNWFMTPLGMHSISLWHAVGLTAMVSIFTGKPPPPRSAAPADGRDEVKEELWRTAWHVVVPAFLLLIGYVAKTHMA